MRPCWHQLSARGLPPPLPLPPAQHCEGHLEVRSRLTPLPVSWAQLSSSKLWQPQRRAGRGPRPAS